jgi:prephenate dehydrogenase
VFVQDIDESIQEFAILSGAADASLDGGALQNCDLLIIALYPLATIEYLDRMAQHIRPETTVIDCCGTKKNVCAAGFQAAVRYGFTFVGGHPMAGIEQSGFKYSKATMFKGAPMIIVPHVYDDIHFLERIKNLLAPAGFGKITVTTAETHDTMIAFTSQMAHLVSNAYIKSPTVFKHKGFSAGSYKDLTRVAWLNEAMWAELFIENRNHLLHELDFFIESLEQYRSALQTGDFNALQALLYDGKRLKEDVDRR